MIIESFLMVLILSTNSIDVTTDCNKFRPIILVSSSETNNYKLINNNWINYENRINTFEKNLYPFYAIERREFHTFDSTKYFIKNEFTCQEEIHYINENKIEDFEKVKEVIYNSLSKLNHAYINICFNDSFKIFSKKLNKALNNNLENQKFYYELVDELIKTINIYQTIFEIDKKIIYFHISKLKESKTLGLFFSIFLFKKICNIFLNNKKKENLLYKQKIDESIIFDKLTNLCNDFINLDSKKLIKKSYFIWRCRSNRVIFCRFVAKIDKIFIFKYIGKLMKNINDQILFDLIVFYIGQTWYERKKSISYDKISGIIMFLTVYLKKQQLGLINKNEQRMEFYQMIKFFQTYDLSIKDYSKLFKKGLNDLRLDNYYLNTIKLCFICRNKKTKNFDSFYEYLEKEAELKSIFYELFNLHMKIKKKIIF